jgi:very-short-patch-repair endonuclease
MPEYKTDPEHRMFAREQRRAPTRAEDMIWQAVRNGRLNGLKFKRQVPFGPYVADFSCTSLRLIVEVDGRTHHDALRALKDGDRDRWFARAGFRVLRLSDDLVLGSPEIAVQRIQEAVALTAPSPGSLRSPPSPSRGEGKEVP